MAKKVLIIFATGGRGHITAANALVEAFGEFHPEVEIKNVDVLNYSSEFFRKVFVDGYNYISARTPKFWGWLYKMFNRPHNQTLAKYISQAAIETKLIGFIKEFKPDYIIATHPLPMQLVSHSKHKDVVDIQSSIVVTDFGCHSFWVDKEVNKYFVATDDVSKCLQGYGVPAEKILTSGIPIELKFSTDVDKKTLRTKLGLKPDMPVVLIVGGQFGFDDLQTVLREVTGKHPEAQLLIVAGRDEALKESINKSELSKQPNISTFGFVDNMHELMIVADVMFTKAGGLTVSESLAKGTPLVINKVIPGQEEDNVEFLLRHKAAVRVSNFVEVGSALNKLLDNPAELEHMQQHCLKLGKPNSSQTVADFVVEKIST